MKKLFCIWLFGMMFSSVFLNACFFDCVNGQKKCLSNEVRLITLGGHGHTVIGFHERPKDAEFVLLRGEVCNYQKVFSDEEEKAVALKTSGSYFSSAVFIHRDIEFLALNRLHVVSHCQDGSIKYFKEISSEIGRCQGLKVLCLCYNYLSELPLSMHRLSGLKVLCLSGNYFDEVPEVIRFLKLKKLDLSGNQITELPSWFAKWVAENGTCVELGGNPITSQKIELINEEIAEVE